jgi:tetratricopeptide (TPR) repeat protein
VPHFTPGWQLGEPDLVISMSEAFEVPASGPDIYRNFVIPIPLERPRWVKGTELRPGNRRIVHHAFILLDPNRTLREVDVEDSQPGFDGMDTRGATSPAGEFISWQPGRMPRFTEPGMSWRLNPGTDLVLQVHMQPTGKPEQLQASVGFYFTDETPTKHPYKLYLQSVDIDIPAGQADYKIRDEFVLPVDVDLLALSPHAHYLGKKMYGFAELPDGSRRWLLKIEDWDLNWQGDYVLDQPMRLPRGTRLVQEFVYDNSSANVRNPFHPPRRVKYGLQATDEMGSLWFQLLPANQADLNVLNREFALKVMQETVARNQKLMSEDPQSVKARVELGKVALATGRFDVARDLFDEAVRIDPAAESALYFAGHVRLRQDQLADGVELLKRCVALKPRHFQAQHDLGMAYLRQQNWQAAAEQFELALQINPYHSTALRNLAIAAIRMQDNARARDALQRAVSVDPADSVAQQMLENVETARN